MADIEQMKKIVPLIKCEITFGQHVCELVFGVNVTDLNYWIQITPVKQPIHNNSVSSWNMPHSGTWTFDSRFDYSLFVFKNIQHGTGTAMRCVFDGM